MHKYSHWTLVNMAVIQRQERTNQDNLKMAPTMRVKTKSPLVRLHLRGLFSSTTPPIITEKNTTIFHLQPTIWADCDNLTVHQM